MNLGGTAFLIRLSLGAPHWSLFWLLCGLMLTAEYLRILSERLPTVFSAGWQLLPHHAIALRLQTWGRSSGARGTVANWLRAYIAYYLLDERARGMKLITVVKRRVAWDPAVAARVAYLQGVRLVPYAQGLRGGLVRDIARGEICIHPRWSNDPWMLIGLLMRRSPWVFDPRDASPLNVAQIRGGVSSAAPLFTAPCLLVSDICSDAPLGSARRDADA